MKSESLSTANSVLMCLALAACPAPQDEGEDGVSTTSMDESGTSGSESGGDTGGPASLEQACMASCEVFTECLGALPLPECVDACITSYEFFEGECFDAAITLNQCIGGLTCDEVQHYLDNAPEPYPCQAEHEAICEGPPDCEVTTSMGANSGECSFEYNCPNDFIVSRKVECDGSVCTCFEDGIEAGGCTDAAAFCAAADIKVAAAECCGWAI